MGLTFYFLYDKIANVGFSQETKKKNRAYPCYFCILDMIKLIAEKKNMTQIWNGPTVIPVTILKLSEKEVASELFKDFKEGDKVKISGISKGKGFQGVVKRHGFHGGPKSHGQKDRLRSPGSIGATAPQRVIKGRKMAGHTGAKRVTVKNMVLAKINEAEKYIMVKGAVPGMRGTVIEIRK